MWTALRGTAREAIRRTVRRALRTTGYDVVRADAHVEPERRLRHLTALGFAPKVVIDIGIAEGTPWLYAAFPDADYLLFEPTREAAAYLRRLEQVLRARSFQVALGDHSGEIEIVVRPEIAMSSVFEEVAPCELTARYPVPMRRFDDLVGPQDLTPPTFCKIDVQGAELMVLRGMGDRLRQIDAMLVEMSTIPTIHGGPDFAQVHAFLDGAGFVLYDVLGLARRPLDGALAQVDFLYVPATSPLRADHRWAASG